MTTPQFPDIAALPYEKARDELASIVAKLEGGQVPLEDSMALWHRAEALAAHCTAWLDGAQAQMQKVQADQSPVDSSGGNAAAAQQAPPTDGAPASPVALSD